MPGDRLLTKRTAGILLHPTSLPSPYGIGDFGPSAKAFIDFLALAGQRAWQVLPIGLTDSVGSPYAPASAMALNWLLISPDRLSADGLLNRPVAPWSDPDSPVRYRDVARRKERLLLESFRFVSSERGPKRARLRWRRFERYQQSWLPDAALWLALKDHFGHSVRWTSWPSGLVRRRPATIRHWREKLRPRIQYHMFVQWVANEQWSAIRRYARHRGITIIGDLPHFVVHDSVDTWADPKNYLLDGHGRPRLVAGVPPDYFSPRGQVWGNPLYDWADQQRNGYRWWRRRFARAFDLYDVVRLDHFRGYVGVWGIRPGAKTARGGRWHQVPGEAMLRFIRRTMPTAQFIAEDLGDVNQEILNARNRLGFPGVRVVQFGFDDLGSIHYLKNLSRRSVAYTGTHDNNTTRGWFTDDAQVRERQHAKQAVHFSNLERVAWSMTKVLYRSRANTILVPLQDVFNLGSEARMNTPGTRTGNWRWRFSAAALRPAVAKKLRQLTSQSGRLT